MIRKIELWIRTYISTIPFWHLYTGQSRKDKKFTKPGVTWLDDISKQHDKDCKKGSTWLIGAFDSVKTSQTNIQADRAFITTYLFYLTSSIIVNLGKTKESSVYKKYAKAIGNTVVDIIVGGIGVILFIVNILLNCLNLIGRKILHKK